MQVRGLIGVGRRNVWSAQSQVLHQIRTGWLVWGVGVPREHKGRGQKQCRLKVFPQLPTLAGGAGEAIVCIWACQASSLPHTLVICPEMQDMGKQATVGRDARPRVHFWEEINIPLTVSSWWPVGVP